MEIRHQNADVSVVVPVFNEVPNNLEALVERLTKVFEPLQLSFELVFVDDGSRDLTAGYLSALASRHEHVRVVVLSRNFGEQAAICAGLKHARGSVVINMDSDLQDPPELIPTMLQHWRNGFDIVSTQQINRHDPVLRLWLTGAFYWVLQKMSSVSIADVGEFRLFSRRAVDALMQMPEKSIFLRHMVPWIGFKQVVIPFQRQQRVEGQSAYNFFRLFRVAVSGLVASSSIPLVFVPLLGLNLALAFGLFLVLYISVTGVVSFPAYMPAILTCFFAAYSMLSLTVLSLYVAATLTESRGRPLFIVSEVISSCDHKVIEEVAPQAVSTH
jgi:glycosyltransferase involved in cell wall biosynthesis